MNAGRSLTVSAPGRLCLAGESLDWMTGGASICASVPLRTRVHAHQTGEAGGVVLASSAPVNSSRLVPDPREPFHQDDPLAHLMAAVRTVEQVGLSTDGVALNVSTELPVGAGVSSSAALMLAAVAALLGMATGRTPDLDRVCRLARHAESVEVGSGAGAMDFLAVSHGGVNQIYPSDPPTVRRLRPALGVPLVLIDTRQRRTTVQVLASKRDRFSSRDPDMLAYVKQTPRVVEHLAGLLAAEPVDYPAVGAALNRAHALLRDRVGCSTPLIEACVQAVLNTGAYGTKLSGSGHGGCLFALVPPGRVHAALAALHAVDASVQVYVLNPKSDGRGLLYQDGDPCCPCSDSYRQTSVITMSNLGQPRISHARREGAS